MRYSLPVFFFLLLSFGALAQWDDTDRLPKEFHQQKRDALRALMPEKSAAVFFANPVRNRSNDVDYQFSQNPNFYYLTGYLEPNAALIILKEPRVFDGVSTNEILFVQDRNPSSEIWTGKRLGVDGAKQMLGFNSVYKGIDLKEFGLNWSTLNEVMVIYPNQPNHSPLANAELGDLVDYFQEATKKSKVVVNESGLKSMMNSLREIKTKEEIGLMQTAMDITIDGFKAMIKQLEPGMSEYEAQAIIEYYSKKGGSEYMGYPSICGGGSNACVLHYTYNRKNLEAKDMFLVDMGAEYHGYTADITRTIPVDGNFSTEEKTIYNLVLQAQNAGIEKCRKGNDFRAAHNAAYDIIAKGLVDLGIIKKESEAKNYFMHGTSHYLGLDVHDAGTYQSLLPGVVMTVEPGIYINQGSNCDPKWWGIGVRIEDDILVTDTDPVIMTISLPRSIEELEKMMAE
ncbi:MAG: aminopeptidase P N-terminal domain-containing protein [Bacteroidetes bacterium]|nr:aminopeptidase P N-terminal domain-containing protein [Bacteroidota bacterium]